MDPGGGAVKTDLEAAASRLMGELQRGLPPGLGHSKALDAASRILGAGAHWHEACSKAAKTSAKAAVYAKEADALDIPGWDACACPEGPWEALAALGRALPAPEGWTSASWKARCRGMWPALAPAIEHAALREGRKATFFDLRAYCTWEGIGRLRLDPDMPENARAALGAWARPWHSAYSPPKDEFAAVAQAWAPVLDFLEALSQRPGNLPEAVQSGTVLVERGSHYSACIAQYLCRKAGIEAKSPKGASRLLRCWFPA